LARRFLFRAMNENLLSCARLPPGNRMTREWVLPVRASRRTMMGCRPNPSAPFFDDIAVQESVQMPVTISNKSKTGVHTVPRNQSLFVLLQINLVQVISAICFGAFLTCMLVTPVVAGTSNNSASRPNIVLILADDLGWADVGLHSGNAPTPQLDRLAQEGLELTQHYVAPVCSPTRAGLLTGRCWSRFGITTPINTLGLPPETVTLPRALQSVGYETCLVGKWHLGSLPKWGPNHFGFDHSYGSLAGGVSPWNHRYKKGPYTVTWHRNDDLIEEDGHVTDLLTDEAVNWIQDRGDKPYFLYLPYTAVHLPVKEPDEWLSRVPESISGDVPRHYAASIMHLDDAVGRIVSALQQRGDREKTLLVFTSDNGGSTAENNDLKYPDDNCPNGRLPGNNLPLRGKKADVYEGGIRVPTIVSWPGHIQPGTFDSPVQITDWMPTFCALADYQSPQDLKWDGDDIMESLLKGVPLSPRSLYTAGVHRRSLALRYGDWKLIVHGADKPASQQRSELYDLAADPHETTNLADSKSDQLQQMQLRLQQATERDGDAVVQ